LHALVGAALGDDEEQRRICGALLNRFGTPKDPQTAKDVAWVCVRFPHMKTDAARTVILAETAVKSDAEELADLRALPFKPPARELPDTPGVLIATLYRAGRHQEAVQVLGKKLEPWGTARDWYFLAMAHHRLGHADEAKRWLTEATRWHDQALQSELKETDRWEQRLELKLIRREAESVVLAAKSAAAPKEKNPPTKPKA
jgi:hypothetical protein